MKKIIFASAILLGTGAFLLSNGSRSQQQVAGPSSAVPRGMIAFFEAETCPNEGQPGGWELFAPLEGRYVVGIVRPDSGRGINGIPSGRSVGEVLRPMPNGPENRPTGRHAHGVEGTYAMVGEPLPPGTGASFFVQGAPANAGAGVSGGSAPRIVSTTTPSGADVPDGTNAPYYTLRPCRFMP